MSIEGGVGRKSSQWVVVANESAAEFYLRNDNSGSLTKEFNLHSEDARRKTGELISDSAGRGFDSVGHGRHAFTNEISPKESAVLRFAGTVTDRILKMSTQGQLKNYVIVSAPRFLGYLRKALRRTSIDEPLLTIDKDVVGFSTADIERIVSTEKQ